jgi:hypothetical protein
VNKDGANTGDLGSLQSSQDGIAQQRWPDTTALETLIDGEATEHHDWNRVRHIALDSSRCAAVGYGANRKRLVPDYTVLLANYVGPGSPTFFVRKIASAEPVVQTAFSASELRPIMAGVYFLGRAHQMR